MILYEDTFEKQINIENQVKDEIEKIISVQESEQAELTDEVEKLAQQNKIEEEAIMDKYGLHEIYTISKNIMN